MSKRLLILLMVIGLIWGDCYMLYALPLCWASIAFFLSINLVTIVVMIELDTRRDAEERAKEGRVKW